MDDRAHSGFQRLFRRLSSPELFAAMERDSRLWKGECPHCRADTTDIWQMGGIRYKARGERRARAVCPGCGRTGWLRFHWTGGDPNALGPRPSSLSLILKFAALIALPILLLVGLIMLVTLLAVG